jgi:hypothetical protein
MKTILVNTINGINHHTSLPCGMEEASLFCILFIEGEYSLYSVETTILDVSTETRCDEVVVACSNSSTGEKVCFRLLVRHSVSEDFLISCLTGLTINGVLIDYVSLVSIRELDLGSSF